MFSQAIDRGTLKQGDIVRHIVFPIARLNSTRLISKVVGAADGKVSVEAVLEGDPKRPYHIAQVQGTHVPCAVLSQCCDVDSHQNPPPHSFVLCKVVPIPARIKQHRPSYETLTANADPYGGARAYIQNFWLGEIPGLQGEYMADYSQVMTASWADYAAVLDGKVAELDDLHRAIFRVKAGAHFGRAAKEDVEAGYEDPFRRSDSPAAPRLRYLERLSRAFRLVTGKD